ncbi:MAG: pilin [Betaproteobacteria bacterium]|nr:pilin [Betaproteobacteria bacterium]
MRAQVSEGSVLAGFVRQSVQAYYSRNQRMPRDNAAAGLPGTDKIIGNYVTGIAVREGAILITFGNRANRNLAGRQLSIRPAIVDGHPVVPIAWVCGGAQAPEKMKLLGKDATTIPAPFLPIDCR